MFWRANMIVGHGYVDQRYLAWYINMNPAHNRYVSSHKLKYKIYTQQIRIYLKKIKVCVRNKNVYYLKEEKVCLKIFSRTFFFCWTFFFWKTSRFPLVCWQADFEGKKKPVIWMVPGSTSPSSPILFKTMFVPGWNVFGTMWFSLLDL